MIKTNPSCGAALLCFSHMLHSIALYAFQFLVNLQHRGRWLSGVPHTVAIGSC